MFLSFFILFDFHLIAGRFPLQSSYEAIYRIHGVRKRESRTGGFPRDYFSIFTGFQTTDTDFHFQVELTLNEFPPSDRFGVPLPSFVLSC